MSQSNLSHRDRKTLQTYVKLMRATEAVTSRGHRHLPDAGLTLSQFGVLEALYHLGPMCQRDIARKILKSTGNITTVLDNLEKRDLVIRKRDPRDRRYFQVELTEKGHDLISRVFPQIAEGLITALSYLDEEELDRLGELCRKLGLGAGKMGKGNANSKRRPDHDR